MSITMRNICSYLLQAFQSAKVIVLFDSEIIAVTLNSVLMVVMDTLFRILIRD